MTLPHTPDPSASPESPATLPAGDSAVTEPTAPTIAPTATPEVETEFTDLERQVMDEFNRRQAQDADAGDGTSGGEKGPGEVPDSPPAVPEPSEEEPDQLTGPVDAPIQIGDATYTTDQLQAAVAVQEWASKLDPSAVAAVDAALSGEYALVPLSDLPAIQAFYAERNNPNPQPPSQPQANGYDPNAPLFDGLTPDPQVAQLQAQVNQLTAAQQQQQYAESITRSKQEISQASEAFYATNPDLTPEDRERLEDYIVQSNLYTSLAQSYPARQATVMAFQQALASDQSIAQRRQQALVDAEVARQMSALGQQTQQMAGSTALSGTSSPPMPSATPQDPQSALIADIARHLQSQ